MRLAVEDIVSAFGSDLNADGLPDLLINGRDPGTGSSRVFVLPEPSLAPSESELTAAPPMVNTIALSGASGRPIGDINGDGIEDVATVRFATPPLIGSVAANSGKILQGGALDGPPLVELGAGAPGGLRLEPLGDLNGDGLADIGATITVGQAAQTSESYVVLTDSTAELVALMPGTGPAMALTNSGAGPIGVGDVNGDGAPDVLTLGAASASILLNRLDRSASATYRALAAPGALARPSPVPGARAAVGFDGGAGPQSGPSLQAAAIDRQAPTLQAPVATAPISWTISTDRSGWQEASVGFEYLPHEVVGMQESTLQLYLRRADGTLQNLQSTVDTARNQIQASTGELGTFVIADASLDKVLAPELTVDPAAACPGFYVATTETLRGEGRWGLSVELREGQSRLLHGGVNVGGGYGSAGRHGFVAVNLGSRQRVEILLEITPGQANGDAGVARLDVVAASGQLVDSTAVDAGNNARAVTLDAGFYTFRIRSAASGGAGQFAAELIARSLDGSPRAFQGGVHVGGLSTTQTATRRGYAAFCIDQAQRAQIRASGRATFGVDAVQVQRLRVLDRNRQLIAEI